MSPRLVGLAILCTVLGHGAALAQNSTSNTSDSGSSSSQSSPTLPQQIRQKLAGQGFTDVNVVPGSFLVSAKDKQGDPVTMIIGPHSMTVFTVSSSGDTPTVGSGGEQSSDNK
jgi:hypothetical protein